MTISTFRAVCSAGGRSILNVWLRHIQIVVSAHLHCSRGSGAVVRTRSVGIAHANVIDACFGQGRPQGCSYWPRCWLCWLNMLDLISEPPETTSGWRTPERFRPEPRGQVTIDEIDHTLDVVASTCSFSSIEIQNKLGRPDVDAINELAQIFRRLHSLSPVGPELMV